MMIMDHQIHIIILYSDGEAVCMITGIQVTIITIIYGDEVMMKIIVQQPTQIDYTEIVEILGQKDNDHAQSDIMSLVHENGVNYQSIG